MAVTSENNSRSRCASPFPSPPGPIVRKVSYSQYSSNGDSFLLQSVSCSKIWNSPSNGHEIGSASDLKTTKVSFTKYTIPQQRTIPELRDSKVNKMARKARVKDVKKLGSVWGKPKMGLFTLFYWSITMTLALAIYFYLYAGRAWEFRPIGRHLQRHLYGQNSALENLEITFNLTVQAENSSLIVFTGGVGVGKSLTASIFLETFPWPGQAKKVAVQHLSDLDFFPLMSIFGWNLLVIEDCSVDIDDKTLNFIKEMLHHAKSKDIRLLVILVCTVRNNEDRISLRSALVRIEPYREIFFESLDRDGVAKCFNREISKMRLTIPDEEVERMIDEQMQPIKEVGGLPGCKQVDMKIIEFIDEDD